MTHAVRAPPKVKPQAMFDRENREDKSRERPFSAPDRRVDEPAGPAAPFPASVDENEPGDTAFATRAVETAPDRAYEDGERWRPLIDPMKVVGGVARSKKIIAATTLAGALLGVALALSTPKKFEAATELIADPRDLQITDHDLTQSGLASDTTLAIVENQVRVLTSGTVLNQVAEKLNLFDDPEFNGQAKGFPGVMTLIRSMLSRDDGAVAGGDDRLRTVVIRNLAESLSVERGGKTFVITIGAKTENGEKSALIANTMADVFLQTYGKMQSDTAGRATDELTGRLGELRKAVETAERKVETFKSEHDLVDAQGRLISDDELLKLNEQLTVARARTLELNAKAASARSVDVDSVVAGTLPEEISSNAMNDLRSQYAKLKQEADRADVRLGPRHPERLALDAQLAGARERIAAELKRIGSSLQTDLKRAVQLEQQLSSRLAQLKVRSGDVNGDQVTARELERDANAKRAVYEAFLLRAKQTGEQKDINTANISVISKAYAPLDPTGPSRALTVLAGLLLGFASGVGLGAMRGVYASLRDTADGRSRRAVPAPRRVAAVEMTPPPRPAAPPVPAEPELAEATAPIEPRPNPVESLRAAIGGALSRRRSNFGETVEPTPAETYPETYEETQAGFDDDMPFAAEDAMQQTESSMYPYYADPNAPFAPQQPAMGYPQPQFQQAPQFQPGMYPQQPYSAQASYYPGGQPPHHPAPQMQPQSFAPAQSYAPQPYAPQPYAAQPYPHMQQPAGYPPAQVWPMQQAPQAYPYGQPAPHHAGPMHYAPSPYAYPQMQEAQGAADEQTPIEEIRASLREFRDAVRDLAESRSRRRYF
ncbi:MAG TPA: GNVR domain-containing protein [Mesorhizobium sp.]